MIKKNIYKILVSKTPPSYGKLRCRYNSSPFSSLPPSACERALIGLASLIATADSLSHSLSISHISKNSWHYCRKQIFFFKYIMLKTVFVKDWGAFHILVHCFVTFEPFRKKGETNEGKKGRIPFRPISSCHLRNNKKKREWVLLSRSASGSKKRRRGKIFRASWAGGFWLIAIKWYRAGRPFVRAEALTGEGMNKKGLVVHCSFLLPPPPVPQHVMRVVHCGLAIIAFNLGK